jgi:hypothetical protein
MGITDLLVPSCPTFPVTLAKAESIAEIDPGLRREDEEGKVSSEAGCAKSFLGHHTKSWEVANMTCTSLSLNHPLL